MDSDVLEDQGLGSCGALADTWRRQGNPLQYSCLENPMDGGAWWAAVHGVVKRRTWLSNFIFTFHFHTLEKEMATYSSVLAWRIPGTGEPGGLLSMESRRVRHDWSDLAAAAADTSPVSCLPTVTMVTQFLKKRRNKNLRNSLEGIDASNTIY